MIAQCDIYGILYQYVRPKADEWLANTEPKAIWEERVMVVAPMPTPAVTEPWLR